MSEANFRQCKNPCAIRKILQLVSVFSLEKCAIIYKRPENLRKSVLCQLCEGEASLISRQRTLYHLFYHCVGADFKSLLSMLLNTLYRN